MGQPGSHRSRARLVGAHYLLGGFDDLPHGVCNAILLPHVASFNVNVCPARFEEIANAMGVDTQHLDAEERAAAAITAIRKLSSDVSFPSGLAELDAKADDIPIRPSGRDRADFPYRDVTDVK